MGNAVIFAGSDVKTLKQNINLNSVTKIMTGGVDPSVTATSANKGSIYLSTLTGYLYMKEDNGSSTNWIKVGQDFVGVKEVLSGTINEVNTSFSITNTPIDDTLVVLRNGLAVPNSEYSFTHPNINFTTAPSVGTKLEGYYLTGGSPAITPLTGVEEVEYRTVTAGENTAKQLTLAQTPLVPNQVVLDIIQGTAQEFSVDYSVSGNILTWNGYDLDGIVVAGTRFRIRYIY